MKLTHYLLAIALFSVFAGSTYAATIEIIDEHSMQHNLVLRCDSNLEASHFDWTFSDGTNFTKIATSEYNSSHPTFAHVYHTFPGNGTYSVSCIARQGAQTDTGSTQVTVNTPATPQEIAQYGGRFNKVTVQHIGGNTMSTRCDLIGAEQTAQSYFYDGDTFYYHPSTSPRVHNFTFPEQKTYEGWCSTGTDFENAPQYHNQGILSSGCSHPYGFCSFAIHAASTDYNFTVPFSNDPNLHGGVYFTRLNPNNYTYEIWCNIPTWREEPKHINFGDGHELWGAAGERFIHTYADPGNYSVLCHYNFPGGFGSDQMGVWYEETLTVTPAGQTSDDPGERSGLWINDDALGSRPISEGNHTIIVSPGEEVSGNIWMEWSDAWPADISVPFGATPSWGDPATSYVQHPPKRGSGAGLVPVNFTAPLQTGTYHYIFAMRAEVDHGDVFSMTNWANNPEVWNDGNDIARWSQAQIDEANAKGWTTGALKAGSGYKSVAVPATAITVIVKQTLNNTGNTSNASVCYNSVKNIPATCTGATITSDTWNGCRTIVCGSKKVLACDKTGFFEMYHQSGSGSEIKVCIADTCIAGNGYAKSSNFPICVGSTTQPPQNNTNQTSNHSVDLVYAPVNGGRSFPFEHNYAFQCKANGFNPTNYTFNFGDGATETRPVFDIYHTYTQNGTYTVTCTATNGTATVSDSMVVTPTIGKISVGQSAYPYGVEVITKNVNGRSATFICEDYGFAADFHHWYVNDPAFQGESQHGGDLPGPKEFTWNFSQSGNYTVTCQAYSADEKQAPTYYDYKTWYHDYSCRGAFYGDCLSISDSSPVSIQESTQACHNTVKDIPATCFGGSITSDTWSGCRFITCQNASGSGSNLQIQACDKTGYFEMYRKTASGQPLQICFGNNCITSGEGYKKSSNFPVCTSATPTEPACTQTFEVCDRKDNDCDGQVDEGGVCGSTCTPAGETCNQKDDDCDGLVDEGDVCSAQNTCYSSVKTIPVTCGSGSKTQDTLGGCRTVTCTDGSRITTVMGCNKPGDYQPTYFELYRQSVTGAQINVCFGNTCLGNNGYAKSSNLPYCTA